jgi:RNA polymerase sigma factor (sigma-70 family)
LCERSKRSHKLAAKLSKAIMDNQPRTRLLYHFCRLQLPGLALTPPRFAKHLQRCYDLYRAKRARAEAAAVFDAYLDNLYAVDWYLCCACLENQARAWEVLFAARASRADCLLIDALRARAVRLFPRDEERQEEAVTEFWGYLIAGEKAGLPILARYDGQRPLVPWLIRVFQNKHISELRASKGIQPLPDDDLDDHVLPFAGEDDGRWHEEFRAAAREWLADLKENDLLLLGLRGRCRMKQRDVAHLLGVHEGNISRQTAKLRDTALDLIGQRLRELGWTGDDLSEFVLKEMDSLLLDEPRLALDRLAAMLARRGKKLPDSLY